MSEEGYTKSYRAKWKNPIFRNLLEAGIWAWMCDTAAWKDTRVGFNGGLIELKRGQLVTSIRFIAKGFCVSEKVVRTVIDRLKNDTMIVTQEAHKGTIITICNYEEYQNTEETEGTQVEVQEARNGHAMGTNKKNLRTKEINKPIFLFFCEFWEAYPVNNRNKGSKNKAEEAYAVALKKTNHEIIMKGIAAYGAYLQATGQSNADACRWLSNERWAEDYSIKPVSVIPPGRYSETKTGVITL